VMQDDGTQLDGMEVVLVARQGKVIIDPGDGFIDKVTFRLRNERSPRSLLALMGTAQEEGQEGPQGHLQALQGIDGRVCCLHTSRISGLVFLVWRQGRGIFFSFLFVCCLNRNASETEIYF